jgi:hypothetical protein
MKIRVLISCILALSIAVSWVTFAKAVVEDDEAAACFLQAKAMVGEVPVLFVPAQQPQEANISDEDVAVFRPAILLPVSQDRPPPGD